MQLISRFKKENENISLVIVGHVDHGKSTLIGRLLFDTKSLPQEKLEEAKKASKGEGEDFEFAFLLDHLQEERENFMTIDTTQTFFKTRKRNYVIIDAPGHLEFVKNMITAAAPAELAILIVDAKEGLKEQTKRHAFIVDMLGLDNLIVAVNKMDLVNYSQERFAVIKEELSQFLSRINISALHFVPLSAKNGDNILRRCRQTRWYKGPTLLEALDSVIIEAKEREQPLRFPVQDIYTLDSEKILVGRVESGKIFKDEEVLLLPEKKEAKVESIKVFNQKKTAAEKGENIGVTLKDGVLAQRGSIISQKENLPKITNNFKANIFWMADEPLRLNDKVIIRCATQESECSIERIQERINSSTLEILQDEAEEIQANEVAAISLRTTKPIIIENFHFIEELGRIVLEGAVTGNIQGTGIIKDI